MGVNSPLVPKFCPTPSPTPFRATWPSSKGAAASHFPAQTQGCDLEAGLGWPWGTPPLLLFIQNEEPDSILRQKTAGFLYTGGVSLAPLHVGFHASVCIAAKSCIHRDQPLTSINCVLVFRSFPESD